MADILTQQNLVIKATDASGLEEASQDDLKKFKELKVKIQDKFKEYKNILAKVDAIKANALTAENMDMLEKMANLDF